MFLPEKGSRVFHIALFVIVVLLTMFLSGAALLPDMFGRLNRALRVEQKRKMETTYRTGAASLRLPLRNFRPGARIPDARIPGEKNPAAQTPGARIPGAKTPTARKPGAKKPGDKNPGSKKPATKKLPELKKKRPRS